MKTKTLTQLLLAIVLVGSAAVYGVEQSIQVAMEGGQSVAQFTIGDSRCVLVDDQIVCMRVVTK
jgi:serine/threonine protein phosphatase PrpC